MTLFKGDRTVRPAAVQAEGQLAAVIEPGIDIEGKLRAAGGTVRLNSRFKGEIVSEGTIVVAEHGDVEAAIQAKVICIAGKVTGNVHATERLEIKDHGVLMGDIHTPVLTVEPGGYFEGECQMPSPQPGGPTASQPREPDAEVSPAPESRDLQL